jgi:hypothetical protein
VAIAAEYRYVRIPQHSRLFRLSGHDNIADIQCIGHVTVMGKRSGVPHRDDELSNLSNEELRSELSRSRGRLNIARSAKLAKQWHKRIHRLETALAARESE